MPSFLTSSTATTGATNAATLSLTLPAAGAWTWQGGDLIVVAMMSGAGASAPTATPSGYTALAGSPIRNTNGCSLGVWWKFATSADVGATTSVTYAAAQSITMQSRIYRASLAAGAAVMNPTTNSAVATATTGTMSTLTPSDSSASIIVALAAGKVSANGLAATHTVPTGYGNAVTATTTLGAAATNVTGSSWDKSTYSSPTGTATTTASATSWFVTMHMEVQASRAGRLYVARQAVNRAGTY